MTMVANALDLLADLIAHARAAGADDVRCTIARLFHATPRCPLDNF